MSRIALFILLAFVFATSSQSIFDNAVGPCIQGRCQTGHWCYFNQCLPQPDPSTAVGPCIRGTCPGNTFCHREECFPL